jgi:hypothetical protein
MYGGASRLSTESVETTLAHLGEISWEWDLNQLRMSHQFMSMSHRLMGMSHRLGFIGPWTATGKLPCADFTQQMKSHWFAQNRKWQPLVAQVTRLSSLRKGDSLKVGQPTPLSSKMISEPLFHWCTLAYKALLLPPVIKGESRESSGSDLESFD